MFSILQSVCSSSSSGKTTWTRVFIVFPRSLWPTRSRPRIDDHKNAQTKVKLRKDGRERASKSFVSSLVSLLQFILFNWLIKERKTAPEQRFSIKLQDGLEIKTGRDRERERKDGRGEFTLIADKRWNVSVCKTASTNCWSLARLATKEFCHLASWTIAPLPPSTYVHIIYIHVVYTYICTALSLPLFSANSLSATWPSQVVVVVAVSSSVWWPNKFVIELATHLCPLKLNKCQCQCIEW